MSAMVTWALKPFAASSCNRLVHGMLVSAVYLQQHCAGMDGTPRLCIRTRALRRSASHLAGGRPSDVPRRAGMAQVAQASMLYICCAIRAPNSQCAGAKIKQSCTIARCFTALICNRTEGDRTNVKLHAGVCYHNRLTTPRRDNTKRVATQKYFLIINALFAGVPLHTLRRRGHIGRLCANKRVGQFLGRYRVA